DRVPVQRLDRVALDVLEHLREQPGGVTRPAILDDEPCCDRSDQEQQGSDEQPRPSHGYDLLHENGTGPSAPRRRLRYPQAYLRRPPSASPRAENGVARRVPGAVPSSAPAGG